MQEWWVNMTRISNTGYLPNHLSSPNELIEKNLEKNFAVGGTPDSAVDPCLNAFWQMPGHGTATLAILAGKKMDMSYCNFNDYIGIYGNIKIVPIRICPSVILLKSSGFVKAMSYILEELAQQGGIDIVTMSMGGLPAASWADLVNTAYDKGIFLVSAAGNNFNKLPTHSTIYPARFRRVVAVCGATYDFSPWVKPAGQGSFSIMEGNYGPRELMDKAIASFSPNITWAAWPYNDVMGICSNGTSSATPQIAAAAALYILKYSEDLDKLSAPWMKVQAIRHALFSSASHQISGDGSSYETYYGNGILNANAMLGIKIPEERDLQIEPQDKVRFPLLKMILNISLVPDSDREEMLETELMQIAMQDPKIMEMVDTEDAANFTQSDYEMIRNRILNSGLASNTLASAIKN